MLSVVPKVDLGIDTQLKNIGATEKAKRALFEKRRNAFKVEQEAFFAERSDALEEATAGQIVRPFRRAKGHGQEEIRRGGGAPTPTLRRRSD
ncbi:BQ5605_C030g10810 [Microbotryum silenes-dioicae]|uniref:BQ5605_C030g10810 protein n=1 Tax=Microbotryum silenes-dioicae TaxID=796604 RepID=A0A2X0PCB4_9BASI|nr:BQ5605_C030g10810 [Microbotryum silenes-dioicae]